MSQDDTPQWSTKLDSKPLESINKFGYLGSTITSSLDNEINVRIWKAHKESMEQQDAHNQDQD